MSTMLLNRALKQKAHGVRATLYGRCYDVVKSLQRRHKNVLLTSCVYWVKNEYILNTGFVNKTKSVLSKPNKKPFQHRQK